MGALGAAAVTAVGLRDPHVPGSWGGCPVLLLTGLPCPGCGGLRAVHDLLAGDVVGALANNALAVVVVVGGAALWLAWTAAALRRRPSGLVDAVTDRRVAVGTVVLVLFTVLRWLPPTAALVAP